MSDSEVRIALLIKCTERRGQVGSKLLHIHGLPDSNIGPETSYTDQCISWNFPDKLPGQYVKLGHILYNSFTTRYVILTAVKAKIIVFWDVTPCNFDDDQRFGKQWEREISTVRRSRQHVLPKLWYLPIKIHDVKSRKIVSSALLTNHPIIRHYMKSYWNKR